MTLTKLVAIGAVAAMCSNPSGAISTGLDGTALRGPIMPVCQQNVPCDGPLAARFDVLSGGKVIATFRSDAEGKFVVKLRPGAYTIRPAADSPIMNPTAQEKSVVVNTEGLTQVQLVFDTGIR